MTRKNRATRVAVPVVAVALAGALVAVVAVDRASAGEGSTRTAASAAPSVGAQAAPADGAAGDDALQALVEDAAGSPLMGRDPASQEQTSLEDAATRPHPVAVRSPKPSSPAGPGTTAKAPSGARTLSAVAAKGVKVGDPKGTGVLGNGCAVGYGRVDQCVPAKAPGGGEQSCAYLLVQFPQGIAVTGKDTLGLDTDGDRLACGPGDADVPAGAHDGHDMSGHDMSGHDMSGHAPAGAGTP